MRLGVGLAAPSATEAQKPVAMFPKLAAFDLALWQTPTCSQWNR